MHIRYNSTAKYYEYDTGSGWSELDLSGHISAAKASYPVGAIFVSTVSTNPATLLGFGTWSAFGTGRTIVGIDSGQTEFDTVEETGGTKTHTLGVTELPAHAHPGSTVAITDPGHTHDVVAWTTQVQSGSGSPKTETTGGHGSVANAAESKVTGITATPTIASQGSGTAHNNLQPYIVVYMWKRTA